MKSASVPAADHTLHWPRVLGGALALLFFLGACGPSEGQIQVHEGAPSQEPGVFPAEQERLPPPGEAWVIFGADTVRAEVAQTPEQRERGLMYRESLEPGRGMFFVFPDVQTRSFWMRNTFIPLDIAYLDANLRIVDIQAMEPMDENTYPSAQPAMFALEVPLGWFAEAGIGVGAEALVVFGPGRP
jgi:uncharacterized protein